MLRDLSFESAALTSSLFRATMNSSPSGEPSELMMLTVPGISEICLRMSSRDPADGKFAATRTCSDSPSFEKSIRVVYSRMIPESSSRFTLYPTTLGWSPSFRPISTNEALEFSASSARIRRSVPSKFNRVPS